MPRIVLYRRQHGRLGYLSRAFLWHVRRFVTRQGKVHISNKRRQLVVFSFDYIAYCINFDGVYERDELDSFFDWINTLKIDTKNAVAIDIGANIGNHSLYFSDCFQTVYSFEPIQRTFKVLSLNAELVKNIICFELGLSDKNATALMRIPPHNIGGGKIGDIPESEAQVVNIRTLDSIFPDLNNIVLIKIDVEGHERHAIIGAQGLIKRNRPIILFEQHLSDFQGGKSTIVSLLQELGYKNFATLRKYPRVDSSHRMNVIVAPFLRLLFGESIRIEIGGHIKPGFHSFIIALPDWFPTHEVPLAFRKSPGERFSG